MSVDNHRHCQYTILGATGVNKDGQGRTWNEIANLNLSTINKTNLVNAMKGNENITQDIADVLTQTDSALGGLKGQIQQVAGQIGVLITGVVKVYIAPNANYFNNAKIGNTKIYEQRSGENFYRVNSNLVEDDWCCDDSFIGTDNKKYIYPGKDSNLTLQYQNYNTPDQKKYPLFSLNQALQFLRRFRANGDVSYQIITQYGDYEYNTSYQTIRLSDAVGGGVLEIGPSMTVAQKERLNGAVKSRNGTANYYTTTNFGDGDLVKVRFVWTDYNPNETDWEKQNYYTPGYYVIRIYDSTVYFTGCGFWLNRGRQANTSYPNPYSSGISFIWFTIYSGNVTFKQCVFRNARIYHTGSPEGLPKYTFTNEHLYDSLSASDWGSSGSYRLNNLEKYELPCVFIQDRLQYQKKDGTNIINDYGFGSYLETTVGASASVNMNRGFVVFRMRNRSAASGCNAITISPSCKLFISYAYDNMTKIQICQEKNDTSTSFNNAFITTPILLDMLSYVSGSKSSVPVTADPIKYAKDQLRIDLLDSNSTEKPTFLETPNNIFTNTKSGYDSNKGSYNSFISILTQNDSDKDIGIGIVRWNGKTVNADGSVD